MSNHKQEAYNKSTMKTLDAKALRAHKENLHAEFEKVKAEAVMHEGVIEEANKNRAKCLEKMAQLKGAYKAVEDLERQIGVKPTLPGNAKRGIATKH